MKKITFTIFSILMFSIGAFSQNLIHHLPFLNDADDLVGNLNGIPINVTFDSEGANFTGSWDDESLSYVSIPSFFNGKQSITISTWFKPTYDGNNWRALYGFGSGEFDHFRFLPTNGDGSGKMDIGVRVQENGKDLDRRYRKDFHINQNVWHHSVITITPNRIISYIDGVKIFVTKPGVNVLDILDNANKIGGNFYKDPFMGKIKDFRVYDNVMSDNQVAQLYVETNESTGIVGAYSITKVTDVSASLDASLNMVGVVYILAKVHGDTAPSVGEMKASSTTISFGDGEENTLKSFEIPSGLPPSTYFDVYFMGESSDGNLKTEITLLKVATKAHEDVVYKWPLEGNTNEVNGSGKDASIEGTVTFMNDNDKARSVAVLEDGYLKVPSVFTGMDEATISLWIRTDEVRTWSRIFSFGRGGQVWDNNYREGFWLISSTDWDGADNPTNPLAFTYNGNGEDNDWTVVDPLFNDYTYTSHPASGEWHHIALTLADEFVIYYDGVEVLRDDYNVVLSDVVDTENYIGKSYYEDPYFKGAISDLQIHGKALNETEVNKIMNNQTLSTNDVFEFDSSIQIYPNPSSDIVKISAKDFERVEIYNVYGQSIQTLKTNNNLEIDTKQLEAGIYILKFVQGKRSISKQLVIK